MKRIWLWLALAGLLCLAAAHGWSRLGGRVSGSAALVAGESVEIGGITLSLLDFSVSRYPDGKPRQFVSNLTLRSGDDSKKGEISINHPLRYRGLWIYQTEDVDPVTQHETTLVVVRDRTIPLAFIGAILLLVAAVCNFFSQSLRPLPSWAHFREMRAFSLRLLVSISMVLIPLFVVLRIVLRPEPPPSLQSSLMAPHVGAYVASYIVLLFAAFGIGRRYVSVGFLLMTLGFVLGGVWGQFCWMNYWQNDPKELASLATWLVYLAYFVFAASPRAERILRWSGAAMILFTSTVVNFVRIFSGLHSY